MRQNTTFVFLFSFLNLQKHFCFGLTRSAKPNKTKLTHLFPSFFHSFATFFTLFLLFFSLFSVKKPVKKDILEFPDCI